jgi:hypothetical protein
MQIAIQARGFPLTDALKNHTQTRLGFTLSHAANRIRRVGIRLSDRAVGRAARTVMRRLEHGVSKRRQELRQQSHNDSTGL